MRTELRAGEEKVLEVKRHWFILVGAFIAMVVLMAFFSAIGWALCHFFALPISIVGLTVGFVDSILIFQFFWKCLQRKHDVWVVTTERVIDEEGVLSHRTKETPLEKIQNVEYYQSFWGRRFGYGDVAIQSAAEQGATIVNMVMNPKELKDKILEYQKRLETRKQEEQAQRMAAAIIASQKKAAENQQAIAAETNEVSSSSTGSPKVIRVIVPQDNQVQEDRRPCPYCGKLIKKGAIICRYCREDLEPVQ